MTEDTRLLRRYVQRRSPEAFRELVARHVDFVFAAALRQVGGDAHRAQDVTQIVFTLLARRAPALTDHPTLAGWLHTTARRTSLRAMRDERRRRAREQEAHRIMHETTASDEAAADWTRVRPVIDEAIADLPARDRDAVLLRFFDGRTHREVAAALASTEDAVRVRIDRALEKLRVGLARRGVASTTAALSIALSVHAGSTSAPAGMIASITAAAAGAGGSAASIEFVAWKIACSTRVWIGAGSAAALIAIGVTTVQNARWREVENALATERALVAANGPRSSQPSDAAAPTGTIADATSAARAVASSAAVAVPMAAAETAPASRETAVAPPQRPVLQLRPTITRAAFVIDTSGSMRDPTTGMLKEQVLLHFWQVLEANSHVRSFQVLDADGRFVLGRTGEWLPNTRETRELLAERILRYPIFSNSNFVPGIARAIRALHAESGAMGVIALGDELLLREGEAVETARLDELNPVGAGGVRPVSINAVAFAVSAPPGVESRSVGAFHRFMSRIAAEHGGAFMPDPQAAPVSTP